MGQGPTKAGAASLGQICCYLAQMRLALGFACLDVKSPLSIYIEREGVRCRSSLSLVRLRPLVPPASAVRRGAGLRRAGEVQGSNPSSVLVQFSSSFGSNPLLNRAGDNLVSYGQGFFSPSAMNSGTCVGNKEEGEVTLADVLQRCDAIIELLQPIQPVRSWVIG
jgi:hypothetical protein